MSAPTDEHSANSAPHAHGSPRGYALVALAAFCWGTWSLFLRRTQSGAGWVAPIVFAAMVLGGLPLLLAARVRDSQRAARTRTRTDYARMLLLGVSDAANAWLFFGAMDRTTVAIAVLSHYLAPTIVSLIAPRWLGTQPHAHAVPRAIVATGGLLLVLQPWHLAAIGPRHLVGAAFGAASALFYATNVVVSKQLAAKFSSEETLVFHSIVSLLVVLPLAPWNALPTLHDAGIIALAGAAIGATAGLCFVSGVAKVPAEHASLLTFLEPITAVLIGVVVFGEPMNALGVAGGAVVIGTGVSAVLAGRKPRAVMSRG